ASVRRAFVTGDRLLRRHHPVKPLGDARGISDGLDRAVADEGVEGGPRGAGKVVCVLDCIVLAGGGLEGEVEIATAALGIDERGHGRDWDTAGIVAVENRHTVNVPAGAAVS